MAVEAKASRLPPLLAAMRPHQWTKNGLVLAPILFAMGDRTQQGISNEYLLHAIFAFVAFCFVSSATYLMNDLRDRELDREHPVKRFRPLASGALSPRGAITGLAVLLIAAGALAWWLPAGFMLYLGGYFVLQTAYSFALKKVAYVDVLIISIGFVLRAASGAAAVQVRVSAWLLVCTFLLALFLGLGKRRHEKVGLSALHDKARPSLRGYSARSLDLGIRWSMILLAFAYVFYTLSPITLEKFGDQRLLATCPLVFLGLWRYNRLIYRSAEGGGQPDKILLTDPIIIGSVLGYALLVWLLIGFNPVLL